MAQAKTSDKQEKAPRKAKAKPKKDASQATLNVAFVLDMSGSMGSIRDATVEGCNTYLQDLKKDKGVDKMRLTFIAFDNQFELWHDDLPMKDVPIIGDEYTPRGGTALNDAIARTIALMDKADKADDKFMMVVLTDGQENASVEYPNIKDHRDPNFGTCPALAALVRSYEERGNWTFVYLGANDPNVEATATAKGFSPDNAAFFTAERQSVGETFAAMSATTMTRNASAYYMSENAMYDAGVGKDYRTTDKPKDGETS